MIVTAVHDLAVEALFASDLQPSQTPPAETVRAAVERMILRHGGDGCAAAVATEFGDHPDVAIGRMNWARATVRAVWPEPVSA
jgi:hypothetical protein